MASLIVIIDLVKAICSVAAQPMTQLRLLDAWMYWTIGEAYLLVA